MTNDESGALLLNIFGNTSKWNSNFEFPYNLRHYHPIRHSSFEKFVIQKYLIMLIETLQTLFKRDLERLSQEIGLYQNEANIWITDGNISNSAGNLCLHLVGNLNTYIGGELGKTGYIRDRDLEFSQKNVPQAELIQMVENTRKVVEEALSEVTPDQLEAEYPLEVFAGKMSTQFFLVHLVAHLSYHLGQINYHRRLLDKLGAEI